VPASGGGTPGKTLASADDSALLLAIHVGDDTNRAQTLFDGLQAKQALLCFDAKATTAGSLNVFTTPTTITLDEGGIVESLAVGPTVAPTEK
jgi:hypothetical protein